MKPKQTYCNSKNLFYLPGSARADFAARFTIGVEWAALLFVPSGRGCIVQTIMKGTALCTRPGKVVVNTRSEAVARVRRLVESREERARTGLFYAEGMRFVSQAAMHRAKIETLILAPSLLSHIYARRLADELRDTGVPAILVSAEIFRSLSLAPDPQGIGAVVRQRWDKLSRIHPQDELCWVALDTIRSPGNLGTILRTSEAVGAAGVILLGDQIDPYDPNVVRATMGALFGQRLVRASEEEFMNWKRRRGVTLIGTSPHAQVDYHAAEYPFPVVLWLGGERQGMSGEQMALCDLVVQIPMVGKSDSLNVSVAASVVLYELFNQKRRKPPG